MKKNITLKNVALFLVGLAILINVCLSFALFLPKKGLQKMDDLSLLYSEEIDVYFGRDDCRYCIKIESILKEIVKKRHVYYFDTNYWRSNPEFENILAKYEITSVPAFIKIRNGKIKEKLLVETGAFLEKNKKQITKFFNDDRETYYSSKTVFSCFSSANTLIIVLSTICIIHLFIKGRKIFVIQILLPLIAAVALCFNAFLVFNEGLLLDIGRFQEPTNSLVIFAINGLLFFSGLILSFNIKEKR